MTDSNPPTTPTRQERAKTTVLEDSFHSVALLLVSPNKTPFFVYDTLLCAHSAFFRAALAGPDTYLETQSRKVYLPGECPENIKSLLLWLYTGNLSHLKPSTPPPSSADSLALLNAHWSKHIELYLVAERLLVPQLRNDIIESLIAVEEESAYLLPGWPLVRRVYEAVMSPKNPLRRLLVDFFAYYGSEECFGESVDCYPKEFLLEFSRAMASLCGPKEFSFKKNAKAYHESLP